MSKIKLGARPKNFAAIVSFVMLDGSTGTIPVTYKYRTKKEFGEFVDRITKDAGEGAEPAGDAFSMARLMAVTVEKNADYLLDALESWGLDEPLTRETAAQLADELPAAAVAIMERYREALTQGRLGN